MKKYYFYLLKKNKIIKLLSSNNKNEVIKNMKEYLGSKTFNSQIDPNEYQCILLKVQNVKYDENQPIKMVFGPIKISINYYFLTKRLSIKNNKDDKRNNHLFLTKIFVEEKINPFLSNDLKLEKRILPYFKKIIDLSIFDKLEKRLLAPKTIDQIIK